MLLKDETGSLSAKWSEFVRMIENGAEAMREIVKDLLETTALHADGFTIEEAGEGSYTVLGRGIEMLVERHDLGNPEAVAYVERRLTEIGVVKELRRAGFNDGDEVRIGEQAFDLHPSA